MKAIAVVLGFTAYTVYSFGYIMIKGYNITLREWVTPLHPYSGTWPPATVPQGSIWPTTGSGGTAAAKAANKASGSANTKAASGAASAGALIGGAASDLTP